MWLAWTFLKRAWSNISLLASLLMLKSFLRQQMEEKELGLVEMKWLYSLVLEDFGAIWANEGF